ncbi:MAG: glycosyltransferase family 2 protein [Bacteroidales bacterium]|nr:glycosyltransferase family 2 protein [Candidatus Colimorpha onthohippi]
MLSAVVITQNEERNIGRCLKSLQGVADEVVVVDSGSTDATKAICDRYGVRWEHHDWEGYAEQKNFANQLAQGDWILSIDADEALSPRLRQQLLDLKQQGFADGVVYRVKRLTNYCGSWIHHCGWYPDAKVRLWKAGMAQWEGSIHETLCYAADMQVVTLMGDLEHYSYYSIEDHARRQPRYYLLDAQKAYDRGQRTCRWGAMYHSLWTFVRDYLIRMGVLDGYAGYTVCRLNAHYTFMKYATLYELGQPKQNQVQEFEPETEQNH